MQRNIVIVVFLVFSINLWAQEIDYNNAKEKAVSFFRAVDKSPNSLKSATTVEVDTFSTYYIPQNKQLKSASISKVPAFYIFNRSDKPGFVIVSGDKRVKEILAHSSSSNFCEINPALKLLLNQYNDEISYVISNNLSISAIKYNASLTVDKFLLGDIQWKQGPDPFNSECPVDLNSKYINKRVPAGCGAIAMAQIMKYYRFPKQGFGIHKNINDTTPAVDFSNQMYLYHQMEDLPPQKLNPEISKLIYHCGVSVDMKYGAKGSNSVLNDIAMSLEKYFGYQKISLLSKIYYPWWWYGDKWEEIMKEEINSKRPIIYRAEDPDNPFLYDDWEIISQHFFIIDGYNSLNEFHVNWGWGCSNGFYNLSSLIPDSCSKKPEYKSGHHMLIGISPRLPDLFPLKYSISKTTIAIGDEFEAAFAMENNGPVASASNVASLHLSSDTILTPGMKGDTYIGEIEFDALAANSCSAVRSKIIELPNNIPPGNYHLFFSADGGQNVEEIWEDNNFASIPVTITAAPKISVSVIGLNFYDALIGSPKQKTIKLTNNGDASITINRIDFTGSGATQFQSSPVAPFTIAPGESFNVIVEFNPDTEGIKTANLEIFTNSNETPEATIALHGSGVASATRVLAVNITDSYNFGNTKINTSRSKTFTIQNIGSTSCTIINLSIEGFKSDQYTITSPTVAPFELGWGETKSITVKFTPTSIGSKNAQLAIYNNSDNFAPVKAIELYGNGTPNYFSGDNNAIVAYEYWFDSRYANRIKTTLPQESFVEMDIDFSTDSLITGLHSFNVRYSDKKGKWSSIASRFFYKMPITNDSPRKIVSCEYWLDDDNASKTILPVSAEQLIVLNNGFDVENLSTGLHCYHIRYQDDAGQWSSVVSEFFYKIPAAATDSPKIVACEYWFDKDYSGKSSLLITPVQHILSLADINVSQLSAGLHTYHIRYKDSGGYWSSVVSEFFHKVNESDNSINLIKGVRYCFNQDSENMSYIRIDTASNPLEYAGSLNVQNLNAGVNTIQLQFLDSRGYWSSVVSDTFLVDNQFLFNLNLDAGWNLLSVPVNVINIDIKDFFQKLIDDKSLIKVQNELGNSLENWGIFGGWKNNIGDILLTEGYKVKLTRNDSLSVSGTQVSYPYGIPLQAGWNIIGYPQLLSYDASAVMQQLIDRKTLIKVQNEMGSSLENWGIFGGWKNNIGNFDAGEGYKVKVSAKDTLWIYSSYPKSFSVLQELQATNHFKPGYSGKRR